MENNQRNSKKRLNSLILLVAFTAVMLIVSTYAWFSAQKNVTISGLEGIVNVAEGLMVSLDAKNWAQAVDLASATNFLDSGYTLENPYTSPTTEATTDGNNNTIPSELIPASATGKEDLNTTPEMTFYRGTNVNVKELYDIMKVDLKEMTPTEADFSGVYAIDLFLQNSSKIDTEAGEAEGTTKETLQLNTNSLLRLITGGSEATGLQYATRVALANFAHTEDTSAATKEARTASVHVTATQSQILKAYEGQNISDIAIWEPNAKDHVEYVVTNNNNITWNNTVKGLYIEDAEANGKFTSTEWLPTYALTDESLSADETLQITAQNSKKGIANIYDWDDTATTGTPAPGVERQIALQTDKSAADYSTYDGGVRNLVSITSPGANVYEFGDEADVVKFDIYKNEITKLRLYVWLEGQDVDTINYASHGGGVHLDLGLVKGATPRQQAS